jgi:hypothetical protein
VAETANVRADPHEQAVLQIHDEGHDVVQISWPQR